MRILALVFLNVILWILPVQAQLWSGIVNPNRASDWTYAGVQGGIPTTRANCTTSACNALAPGGSGSVTTATINAALSGAPANTVVRIRAGTFDLTGTITTPSNITLRGAGPNGTILNMSNPSNVCDPGGLGTQSVCMGQDTAGGGYYDGPQNTATWTAGYAKGTSVITLSASPPVGRLIILDQIMDTPGSSGLNVSNIGASLCRGSGSGERCYIQPVVVQSVSGTGPYQVTISPPIQGAYWSSGHTPGAYWSNLQGDAEGLEDIKIIQAAGGWMVATLKHCKGCWLKNVSFVETYGGSPGCCGGRAHVAIIESIHTTVRDSYFYGTHSANVQSYGVEDDPAGFSLVENNIFEHIVAGIVPGTTTGSVFAYNYHIDNFCALGGAACSSGQQMSAIQPHDAGSMMNLFEGNDGQSMAFDYLHGSTPMNTIFRNHMGTFDPGTTNGRYALYIGSYGRYQNVIGNVFGKAGTTTSYQQEDNTGVNCGLAIYHLGYPGFGDCNTNGTVSVTTNTGVASTMFRWGNYDVINGTTRFLSAEVPTADAFYPNAVPASQTLPPSFYLSVQPSAWWGTPWGTPPWPTIGPDVTGGNVTLGVGGESTLDGHAYKIPARLCYENTSKTGGILNFDAASCYSGSSSGDKVPPATPVNLHIS